MGKQDGAFLTIGELAAELDVPQHILRYWETRFPSLKPLQRAGNRRYYRPEDVALARRIHHLLTVEGYTVRGAQQALAGRNGEPVAKATRRAQPVPAPGSDPVPAANRPAMSDQERQQLVLRLAAVRETLRQTLA
jgi:DNA-binding transcriptional MerR regulator